MCQTSYKKAASINDLSSFDIASYSHSPKLPEFYSPNFSFSNIEKTPFMECLHVTDTVLSPLCYTRGA